jgi:ribosomal protein S18 acetylase RimI-like enzyme
MYTEILNLATQLFCKEDHPAIRKALRDCLVHLTKIYVVDGSVQAFAIVCSDKANIATIAFCGVSPLLQGQGIGSKLLKETISGIFHAGFTSCQLIVDDWNLGARKLYEKLGFIPIGPIREDHTIGTIMQLTNPEKLTDCVLQSRQIPQKWITANSL